MADLTIVPRHHHLAIQAGDLESSVAWYRDFFGAEEKWTLEEFSELTASRLPGIRRLVEVLVGDVRFHLFDRDGCGAESPPTQARQFQHLCMAVESPGELREMRRRWIELRASGRYRFALPDGPTDIVTDADGAQSFYAHDVNGLEFEFTYVPGAR
ncbi:VOC family protein [Actinomadura adrarensis]|uniref:VOC family protein n=1 Tax=Actinomadura adrarensis TaxID=1819600 RepID=A0ABW3CTA2_9ACTN